MHISTLADQLQALKPRFLHVQVICLECY